MNQQILEGEMGIEPTFRAWEAPILPLNYSRARPALLDPPKPCKESTAIIHTRLNTCTSRLRN